jgi:hypothetical protein
MRKPATCEIEHAVDAPVRAFAGGFADAGAVGQTQRSAGPAQIGAGRFRRQQPPDQGGEEGYRLFQPIMHARIGQFGDLQQRHPTSGLTQRKPAWAAGQREP